MSKRKFRIVVFGLLFAGLALTVIAAVAREGQTRTILLTLTGAFYLAAATQIVVYRTRPKAFDDQKVREN